MCQDSSVLLHSTFILLSYKKYIVLNAGIALQPKNSSLTVKNKFAVNVYTYYTVLVGSEIKTKKNLTKD